MESSPNSISAFSIISTMTKYSCIKSAIDIGLFEFLHQQKGFCTLKEIKKSCQLACEERNLLDLLDILHSQGLLKRESLDLESKYALANAFFVKENPLNIIGFFKFQERLLRNFNDVTDLLRTGKRKNLSNTFDEIYKNPEDAKAFLRAMGMFQRDRFEYIAKHEDLSHVKQILDVGGCLGNFLSLIKQKYNDKIECVNFDLPVVQHYFEEYVNEQGLAGKIQFHEGSFLTDDLPSNNDCIMMGNILHDWNSETKHLLIQKVYKSLNPGGVFIIAERFIDENRTNLEGLTASYLMLVECINGFNFSTTELMNYLIKNGFVNVTFKGSQSDSILYATAIKPKLN